MFIFTPFLHQHAEISSSVGRVLDWESKGCKFEIQRSLCAVSLSMILYPPLSPDMTEKVLNEA